MLLLTFTAGANRYAVDVAWVVEVVPNVELRPIPHAPTFLAGLLGYRGKVVPVIDLGLLLNGAPCRDCLSTRIILVNDTPAAHSRSRLDRGGSPEETEGSRAELQHDSNLLGLVAEHVSDLTHARPEQVVSTPVRLPQAPYLDAIVQTDQGIVQLIAVDKLRDASLRLSSLGQGTALNSKSEPWPLTT